MTVSYKKSRSGAYYINSQTLEDYYASTSEKEPPGIWHFSPRFGESVDSMFGESNGEKFDAASTEAFGMLCSGFNPEDGSALTQNAGKAERVALHDFTFSAPKSFSVVWGLTENAELRETIGKAQLNGVKMAIDLMSEKAAYTRQGKAGHTKVKGSLISALFEHGSSRENDPQLHTHGVILNLVQRPDGKFGALEKRDMMRWQGAAASIYHANLAWAARQAGAEVVMEGRLPEIKDVPQHVREAYSKRRQRIEAAVEAAQSELGMSTDAARASRGLYQKATIETRDAKSELSRAELKELWLREGAELGYTEAEILQAFSHGTPPALSVDDLMELARAALDDLTEKDAVFTEPSLYTAVAVGLCGEASPEQIMAMAEAMKAELLTTQRIDELTGTAETIYTTRQQLLAEEDIRLMCGRTAGEHRIDKKVVDKAIAQRDQALKKTVAAELKKRGLDPADATGLEREQIEAIRHICESDDAISVLEGTAGAGKTFSIKSVGEIYSSQGYQVHALSGAWTQALNLKKEADFDSGRAIAAWLAELRSGKLVLDAKAVIILDEAGMVGTREMRAVLREAERAGCKVVLLGDTLQQTAVSAGDALRMVVREQGSARLDTIRRQKSETERQGVKDLFAGRGVEGFAAFQHRAQVLESAEQVRFAMISDWLRGKLRDGDHMGRGRADTAARTLFEGRDSKAIKTHLMQASDKATVFELNQLAHDALRAAGKLGEDSVRLETMDCPAGERVEFSVGDEVVFRINRRDLGGDGTTEASEVFNRVKGVIVGIDDQDRLQIMTSDRALVTLDPKDEAWQHADGGVALQHAYAQTVYAGQGVTVDHTYNADSAALNRRSAGVMMSRHREEAHVYIDREARYESKMKNTDASDWHHIGKFDDAECMARTAQSWGRESEKSNATDFAQWRTGEGVYVQADQALAIEELEQVVQHMDELQASTEAADVLPFQNESWYELRTRDSQRIAPEQRAELERRGRMDLAVDGISSRVIADARDQGMLDFDNAGRPVFDGYRPGQSKHTGHGPVNRLADDGTKAEGALRDRFPPILRGDPDHVAVVKSGRDALALWTQADQRKEPRPTVVVASGDVREATALWHVRDLVKNAKTVEIIPSREASDGAKRAADEAIRRSGGPQPTRSERRPAEEVKTAAQEEAKQELKKDYQREQQERMAPRPGQSY